MKQLPHVSGLLYGQPWAIRPESHAELSALYRAYIAGKLPPMPENTGAERPLPRGLDRGRWLSSGIAYEFDDRSGIAVIYLAGIITKRAPDILCGPQLVDLAVLDSLLDEVMMEERCETVILDIDSPGGCCVGLEETAANLRDLAESKRLIAYTEASMCSAAYWIACAADEIYAAPTSIIGSIGSYMAGLDDSRAWEMEGLELVIAKSGSLKATGHPGKAWTDEERQWMQETNEACWQEFRGWVLSRRGDVPESSLQGQWFMAKDPAASMLTDGLRRSLREVITEVMAAGV